MENCHFLDQPPTPISLRNIKMAPNYTFMSASLLPDFIYKKRKFRHIVTEFEGKNYHVLKKNHVLSQEMNVKIVLT